jgi:hypothetical protein
MRCFSTGNNKLSEALLVARKNATTRHRFQLPPNFAKIKCLSIIDKYSQAYAPKPDYKAGTPTPPNRPPPSTIFPWMNYV